jgi:hypothetical protein
LGVGVRITLIESAEAHLVVDDRLEAEHLLG